MCNEGRDDFAADRKGTAQLYEEVLQSDKDKCNKVSVIYQMPVLYEACAHGVVNNTARAAELFQRIVGEDGDNVDAVYRLARMALDGVEGVELDHRRRMRLK